MLRTKSFKLSDSDGVNKLLDHYRLAPGAGIFVSNGDIMISYEDGAPQNKAQKIIEIRENQNKLRSEMEIIEHSNRVLRHLIADADERVNVAKAKAEKETANQPRKAAEGKVAEAQNALDQLMNQKLMNEHELTRLQVNIDEYEASITKLNA